MPVSTFASAFKSLLKDPLGFAQVIAHGGGRRVWVASRECAGEALEAFQHDTARCAIAEGEGAQVADVVGIKLDRPQQSPVGYESQPSRAIAVIRLDEAIRV